MMMTVAPDITEKKEKLEPAFKDGDWPTESEKVTCHHCGADEMTKFHSKAGILAWISCFVICLFGFWCGCCLIPFCISALNEQSHKCARCGKFLGVNKLA